MSTKHRKQQTVGANECLNLNLHQMIRTQREYTREAVKEVNFQKPKSIAMVRQQLEQLEKKKW